MGPRRHASGACVTVRPAGARDASAVAAIWNHYIRDTMVTFNATEKSWAEVAELMDLRGAQGFAFLVAEGADGVAGFATYAQFRAGVGYARTMEHTVLLAPAACGRGIGHALMSVLEGHARARGAHSLFAGVSGENPAGIAFHAARGYTETARLPEVGYKAGRWLDLVLMQKRLDTVPDFATAEE